MSRKLEKAKAKAYDILSEAVRLKCRDNCCCGDLRSWKECQSEKSCPLWKHRLGQPFRDSKEKSGNHEGKSKNSGQKEVLEGKI